MEGLRYAAIVEANLKPLANEAGKRFGVKVDDKMPPIVQVLGPRSWWRDWLDPRLKNRAAGDWNRAFARLASAVEARIGAAVECMAMDGNTRIHPWPKWTGTVARPSADPVPRPSRPESGSIRSSAVGRPPSMSGAASPPCLRGSSIGRY